jgi:3-hydroxyisobutyrate dehydrogenase/glyoxylate/succinic semialdehyde reductase
MVKLGFIGLGIMGSRMAANLQKKSYELIVHNRTKSKAEALLANGATWAETPAELARQVDVLFTMLASPPVVEQVALGRSGFLDQLRQGAIWVDCSTVNPSFSRRMAAEASERGVRFLDAPEAGTKGPAERGELVVLVGGEQADFQACQPFLEAFGRKVINVGGYGMGTSMRCCSIHCWAARW